MEDTTIPSDVLTDPEALDKFMMLYESKVTYIQDNLDELNEQRKECEKQLALFKERYDILIQYKVFLESDGFGVVKQTVDSHAEEIREAQKERLRIDEETWDDDDETYQIEMCNRHPGCFLPAGHQGYCATKTA